MYDRYIMSAEDACAFSPSRQAEAHKKTVFVSRRKPNVLGEERATKKQATANRRQFSEAAQAPLGGSVAWREWRCAARRDRETPIGHRKVGPAL